MDSSLINFVGPYLKNSLNHRPVRHNQFARLERPEGPFPWILFIPKKNACIDLVSFFWIV
jgi:hypothetical protein